MISQPDDITASASSVDTKSLATLITELNIARRNNSAYPKGHPVISSSLAKVLRVYDELLNKQEEVIIGVTNDALMVDGEIFEKSNLVYRDFSRVLFERGIGALIFHRGLSIEELNNFTVILSLKREQINQSGGIEKIWSDARITSMVIKPIRYDLFQTTDENIAECENSAPPDESIWDRFARILTHNEISHEAIKKHGFDPIILAKILNQQFSSGTINKSDISAAITKLLAAADGATFPETSPDEHYQKLSEFISNLKPELRRQFLDSTFKAKSDGSQIVTERILAELSETAILETLEDINQNRLNVSSTVFGLLQRLGRGSTSQQHIYEDAAEDNSLANKLKTIFKEHASEEFVPDDYQRKLNHIISTDQIPRLNIEEVSDLLKTLENRSIENSIGQILMNLIRQGVETPEERDLLLENLSDMFGFFLQTGDYPQLHKMIDNMSDGTFPVEIQYRLRDEYGRREFLDEILDGLTIWGKPRYEDIRSLIHKIGGLFVEAILDRLAEEKNMSIRRFYMDRLIEMGVLTRAPIANRLHDKRWYFLRNLLIILSAQNDPAVVPLIKPLLRNEDPRLRHEALKTLVHFHDPQAERMVLNDLNSQNMEIQTTAIQLAERCSAPAVSAKLISMLSQGGFSQVDCDRKSAIIHSLSETGRAEALPVLAKILGSRSLLNSKQLTKLKTEIIKSLPKYPPKVARPILEHITESSGELARLAADAIKIISGKSV